MKKIFLSVVFTLAILIGLVAAFSSGVSADQGHGFDGYSGPGDGGAVFTMTNPNGAANAVIMFSRDNHGALNMVGSFATGGNGGLRSGPPDPLKS